MRSQYFDELTALRGIAAFGVLWFHYTSQFHALFGHAELPFFMFEAGRFGVQLFFCISGFVILLSLDQTERTASFFVKRAIRLYPSYWVAIVVTFVFMACLPLPNYQVGVSSALINLSMLQYWLLVPHVDDVYWTLSVELVFYFWMGVVHCLKLMPKIERILQLLFLVVFACRFAEIFDIHVPVLIRAALLLDHGHYFALGILLNRLMFAGASFGRHGMIACVILTEFYTRGLEYGVALAFISSVGYAFIFGKLGLLRRRPFIFLGDISYPLYLIHQNIGYSILWHMQKYGFKSQCWILLPVAVSILIAWLMHLWVEESISQRLKCAFEKSNVKRCV